MTSDWWFLAMIGSAASAVGGALGTAASSALSSLGTLASGAGGSIGTAAGSALQHLGIGTGTTGAGAGTAAPTAGAISSPAMGAGLSPAEASAGGTGSVAPTASSVSTANLPPAAGGTRLAAPPASSPGGGSGGGSGGGGGFLSNLLGGGSSQNQIGVSTEQGPMSVPPGAQNLSQASPMPTSPSLTSHLGNMGLNLVAGGPYAGTQGGSFLSNVPGALYQRGLSTVSGFPMGATGQGFGADLGSALRGRFLSTLSPGGGGAAGGQSPEQMMAMMHLLLGQQGMNARQLPLYGNLPGYG